MNRTRSRLVVLIVSLLAVLGVVAPASAAADPYCGITWGSLSKTAGSWNVAPGPLTEIRGGRHACFDRLVIDMAAPASTAVRYSVSYVPTVHEEGTGNRIPLRGAADLAVVVHARADDGRGHATYVPDDRREAVNVSGYTTFRQVAYGGSFEAVTTVGLGVRARLPFRAFLLPGPPVNASGARLVIDVAHSW
jgi:hypothetical protein